MNLTDELQLFLSPYPGELRKELLAARELIFKKFPGILETVDHPAKLVAYSYGSSYKDMICVLIPSRADAKLSFSRGAELAATFPQLQGDGKKTRYVSLVQVSPDSLLVDELLTAALSLYQDDKK